MQIQSDDFDDESCKKCQIPKHKILFLDAEISKKEPENSNLPTAERERQNTVTIKESVIKKEKDDKKFADKIIEYAAEAVNDSTIDKEISSSLKRKLDQDPDMNNPSVTNAEKGVEEAGVWQVIVGRQFAASVTFDSKYMIYFLFEELGKYFLVFRS